MVIILFYDFEVFKYDWLAVFIDVTTKEKHVIINDPDKLTKLYEANFKDIWVGYNNKHYDQYIMKGIMLSMDPKQINDWIIVQGKEGWQFSKAFNRVPMINYDVMPNPPVGLKTLEGFLGSNIKETDVDFRINRKLTPLEIDQTIFYCTHDVEETIKVFLEKIDDFNAMLGIVHAFPYVGGNRPAITCIGDSEARITAKVLDCVKQDFNDEFEYFVLPCVKLGKYRYVQEWFEHAAADCRKEMIQMQRDPKVAIQERYKYDPDDQFWFSQFFYKRSLETMVAGVPHTFGWGGLHGAPDKPVHMTGRILHVDVGSYYPSMLIAWALITRAARRPEQYKNVYDTRMALKRAHKKKEQAPYKKILNAASGAMKDKTNPAYDPRNNNCMCINGQLMLLDLIEKLEVIPGFELIQSNTDGLIIRIPDTQEAFDMVDDICFDWETRCSTDRCQILLGLDMISEIYQKDVNNYLWKNSDGEVERIGKYLKKLSNVDNNLPILNKALVDYMVDKVPVEQTIRQCTDLIQFQNLVKLSDKYNHVEHEHCQPTVTQTGKRVIKELLTYDKTETYTYKSYRVFASADIQDGRLLKCGGKRGKPEKFADTPDHCFICNDDVTDMRVLPKLDRQWYIDLAKKRLKQFGVTV